jgi:Bacterial Ig-like domain
MNSRALAVASVLSIASAVASGCSKSGSSSGGGTSPTAPSSPTASLTITGVHALTGIGQTYQLQTTDASGKDVTFLVMYQSSNPGVATVGAAGMTAGLVTAVANGTTQITATEGSVSTTFSVTVSATAAPWVDEGPRFSSADFSLPNDSGFADGGAILLPGGGIRIVLSHGVQAYLSESSPDGLSFSPDPGTRAFTNADGSPASPHLSTIHMLRLDDGSVRLYGSTQGANAGEYSALSQDDGLTWTKDDGVRLSGSGYSGFSIVRQGGMYRAYFAMGNAAGQISGGPTAIVSATSSDTMNWTMDGGVRIAAGASPAGAPGSPYHPSAILNPDGSVLLMYVRFPDGGTDHSTSYGLWTSTSTDGLTFSNETWTNLLGCADPELVRTGGTLRAYFDGCPSDTFGSAHQGGGVPTAVLTRTSSPPTAAPPAPSLPAVRPSPAPVVPAWKAVRQR